MQLNPKTAQRQWARNFKVKRKMNNTKGVRCIVSKIGILSFVKYGAYRQTIGNKQIEHLVLC